jgi:hypothetical protein
MFLATKLTSIVDLQELSSSSIPPMIFHLFEGFGRGDIDLPTHSSFE